MYMIYQLLTKIGPVDWKMSKSLIEAVIHGTTLEQFLCNVPIFPSSIPGFENFHLVGYTFVSNAINHDLNIHDFTIEN